jgi:tetratricopeptide (TPR) repeat protein
METRARNFTAAHDSISHPLPVATGLLSCYMVPRAPLPAIVALLVVFPLAPGLHADRQDSADALVTRAEALAYDLDHQEALTLLRQSIALAPSDPRTHRALANVLWLNLLFQRGAVTVDHYLGSFSSSTVDLKKPPPEVDAEFRREVGKAIELAEHRVATRPNDAQAHYDLGAAVGLQATYVATVEGRLLAGFRNARRAYDEHERVLALDPSRKDAGLIVGTYRYVVSTLSFPMRMMAYVAGFGGGRDVGIGMIEGAAATPSDSRVDAIFALVLMYNRERRYDDALRMLQELRRLHPRNRLVVLEAGSTALRGGNAVRAEELLTEGLAMLAADKRPRIPGEDGLWRYKRGAARVERGRLEEAAQDLQAAVSPDSAAWVQGRARVELARIALTRSDAAAAAAQARQAEALCEQGRDPVCANDARKVLRSARGR